jgi:hypothetical protein
MKTTIQTETMLLRDPELQPTREVLKGALGGSYPLYEDLTEVSKTLDVIPEWNYYKDGKAWLCKAVHKKKTVFWLSVWNEYFKVVFYFTAKTCAGITDLDIDENLKRDFCEHESYGKFMPLIFVVTEREQIEDIVKVIHYKKRLK